MLNSFSYPFFKIDLLSGFVAAAIGVFFVLTMVYSVKFMKGTPRPFQYYLYVILTAASAIGAVLANNLMILLVLWGFLGLLLYLLINMGNETSNTAAKKSLVIVGGTDALMLFGIGVIYFLTRTLQMDAIKLEPNTPLLACAYLCIVFACFAKAGAMPFHSWIPDCAKDAPAPVAAYLPASLDKLLGIYLLVRVSLDLFIMNEFTNIFLMLIGALTIIGAVIMALVQHNLKRLLGYHAVSQVGYMVLGIGTGNPVGIAGGVFHMLNHAVYKSCLFFSAGNVEYRAKTAELDELGGLARFMPVTYITCMVASFSISGIPPFNGFVSKWMIYQGLIERVQGLGASAVGGSAFGERALGIVAIFCLAAAMFGSALTVASFMKLLHAVFLGQQSPNLKGREIKEVPRSMLFPCVILAAVCVIFGVFAFALPLKYFIFPLVSINKSALIGNWSPVLATALLLSGLAVGFIVFKLGKIHFRKDSPYFGCETTSFNDENPVTGTDFYNAVREIGFLKKIYKNAEEGKLDIYEQGRRGIFSLSGALQYLHNGVLPSYLVWFLLGMLGLFLIFLI